MDYIGIFDSGVGGLGIFSEIKKLLPSENILYLADTANCPYGEKSINEIEKICKHNVEFLIKRGAKIIVVACNSASVSALNYLRTEFPNMPIVGVVPVVKTAAKITKNKRIGILATKRTVESEYLKDLVQEFCPKEKGFKVYYQAANELVGMVENLKSKTYNLQPLRKSLNLFIKKNVDVVALGCTHFPFLRHEIEEILGPNVQVLDSNGAVARQVARVLTNNKQLSKNKTAVYYFYASGDKNKMQKQCLSLVNSLPNDCFFSHV